MATAEEYASWIVANADKKGTPEFNTVAQAYNLAKSGVVKPKAPIETPQFEKDAAANLEPGIIGQVGRQLGLTARAGIKGLTAIPAVVGDAIGMDSSGAVDRALSMVGLPAPANATERVAQDVAGALSGVGGMAKVGALASGPVQQLLTQNLGTQAAMSAGGAGGSSIARENGAGPIGQLAAGVAGSVAPVAGAAVGQAGYRSLRNILDDFLSAAGNTGAAQRQGGRIAVAAAGERAPQVISALENSTNNVPGSNLTAGQAAVPANSAEFAALQKAVQQANPSAYAGTGVEGAQEAARRALVQEVGQTPQALEAAQAARAADASRNYGAAYAQTVRADPQLAQMAQNPYFQDALTTAQKLAEAKGIDPKNNLTEFLQLVKFGLDKQLGKTGDTALVGEERKAAYAAKKELVDWMGRKNPAYESARQEFAAASKPINQMEVGQELEKTLVTPVGAGERPGVFANAVNNAGRTIKAATGPTGGPRFDKLEEVLTPEQVNKIQMVMRDLTQDAKFEELAGKGAGAVGKTIRRENDVIKQVPTMSSTVKIFNFLTRHLEGLGGDKAMKQLAIDMQSPKKMAQIMRDATPAERMALKEFVMRLGTANAADVKEATQ